METKERRQYRLDCPLRKEYILGKIKRAVCSVQDKNCTHKTKCIRMNKYDEGLI